MPWRTGAMILQVKSLFGPRPKVTLAPTAREKYFSVISAILVSACSRSDSPVSPWWPATRTSTCLKLLTSSGAALRTVAKPASTSPGEACPKRIDQPANKRAMALKFLSRGKVWTRRPGFANRHWPRCNWHPDASGVGDQAEADLPASSQFDIDLGEQLSVKEGAVLHPLTPVDTEAHAQGVKAVLRARVTSA